MFTWLLNDLLISQLKITEAFKSKGWFKNHMDKQGGKGVGHKMPMLLNSPSVFLWPLA